MKRVVIREGKALLYLPDFDIAVSGSRFEPAWLPVFYNPAMIFNRDLGIIILNEYILSYAPHTPIRGFDALAASGVRGIRTLLEVNNVDLMYFNDINYLSYKFILDNTKLNNILNKSKIFNLDANAALSITRTKLHDPILYIDIDPFGSPVPFTREAIATIGHHGLLAITATDLAVLECRKPKPCQRKYLAKCIRVPESKEIGLRILLGFIARMAAQTDKAIKPLLAYYADHYYRAYFLIERGARHADAMLEKELGYAFYCQELRRTYLGKPPERCSKYTILGPLWLGPLGDSLFINTLYDKLDNYKYMITIDRIYKYINILKNEYKIIYDKLYYRLDTIAARNKVTMPKRERLLNILREKGYTAARTHFDPQGIRTNATLEEVEKALLEASLRRS